MFFLVVIFPSLKATKVILNLQCVNAIITIFAIENVHSFFHIHISY